MAQDAVTKVFSVGISADAAAELVQFVAFQVAKGRYVPIALMDMAEELAQELGVTFEEGGG